MSKPFSTRSLPLALGLLFAAAFGIHLGGAGIYLDDWHHLYFAAARGLDSLRELLLYDNRPNAAIFHRLGFQLLGFQALPWQIFSLAMRYAAVLLAWLSLRLLWPAAPRQAAWAAFLFAVYPLFSLQPMAMAYSLHWTGFVLYLVSIACMIQAARKPGRFWPFTVLALLSAAAHLFLLEYFAGVELIRPFLLWLLLPGAGWPRLRQTVQRWAPYLFLFALFAAYRVMWMPVPNRDRNLPITLLNLAQNPIAALLQQLQTFLQDSMTMLYSAWQQALRPELFDVTDLGSLIALGAAGLAGAGLFFYLSRLDFPAPAAAPPGSPWAKSGLLTGLLWMALGPIPAWITGQGLSVDNPLWSNRFGLASTLGISLAFVALLEILVSRPKARLAALCILVGLATAWQVSKADEFRLVWLKERRFFHQLAWRAPYLEPGTAILSDGEIFMHMTERSTALGALYPAQEKERSYKYWFFSIYGTFGGETAELAAGKALQASAFGSTFRGNSLDSLVISFEPDLGQCLWVLRPQDQVIRTLPDVTRQAAAISNLSRIKIDSPFEQPAPAFFGSPPQPAWCYYFEKADLARQFGDWETALRLWQQAQEAGLAPGNPVEALPFIEAYAYTGQWAQAEALTDQASQLTPRLPKVLCAAWKQIEAASPPSAEGEAVIQGVYQRLKCGQ